MKHNKHSRKHARKLMKIKLLKEAIARLKK